MKVDIKAFLCNEDIKKFLRKNDLNQIYAEFDFISNGTEFSVSLTDFFIRNGIEPLKYFENYIPWHYEIYGNHYTNLDLVNFRNIIQIGKSAFQASHIQTFKGSSSLEYLADFCFADCHSLHKVDLDMCENMTSLPDGCFEQCVSLEAFILPPNLQYIGIGALDRGRDNCYYIKQSDSATKLVASYGDRYDFTIF